jgi:hypothetical protein
LEANRRISAANKRELAPPCVNDKRYHELIWSQARCISMRYFGAWEASQIGGVTSHQKNTQESNR